MRIGDVIIGIFIMGVILTVMVPPLTLSGIDIIDAEDVEVMNNVTNEWNFANPAEGTAAKKTITQFDKMASSATSGDIINATLNAYNLLISITMFMASLLFSGFKLFVLPVTVFVNMITSVTVGVPVIGSLITAFGSILSTVIVITILFFAIRFATGRDDNL